MNDPLVSIILRSYNEAWALRDTLPALQAQEYKNWELIVIDLASFSIAAQIRSSDPMFSSVDANYGITPMPTYFMSNTSLAFALIRGGTEAKLGPGDVLHIPAKVAHQMKLGPGAKVTYFVTKVVE